MTWPTLSTSPTFFPAVVFCTERAIAKEKGEDPEKALEDGYFKRLWHFLSTTDAEFKKAEFNIPKLGKFVFEMKNTPGSPGKNPNDHRRRFFPIHQ